MKKIVISESQLKMITKSLLSEQLLNINIEGRKGEINPDGTISLLNKLGQKIKIRLKTARLGDVNIVKFVKKEDGNYEIETKMGTNKEFKLDKVNQLINFLDSSNTKSSALDSSIITGPLTAHKV